MSHVLLVVANDDAMLEMVHLVLRCNGYTVFVVRTPAEVAAIAEHQKIDLVVADTRTAAVGGRELATTLESIPRLARVPIMQVSGIGVDRSGRVTGGGGPIPLRQFVDDVHAFFARRPRPTPVRPVRSRPDALRRKAPASA